MERLMMAKTVKRLLYLSSVQLIVAIVLLASCKDDPGTEPTPEPPVEEEEKEPIVPGQDPTLAKTIGFFADGWTAKTFVKPAFQEVAAPTSTTVTVTVDNGTMLTKIPPTMFAQNANTWMTRMVDQVDFMKHITNLHPRIIRWPAGSGSDAYFWNVKPGQLPADVPVQLVDNAGVKKDPGYMYGNTNDDWRASLDNYYQMLAQSNNTGIITVNYGYARYGTSANPVATAAHLAAEWVRYDNGRTKYWEIGNEVYADWEWGYRIDVTNNHDGQPEFLTGKLYAQHFKVYADSMRKAAKEVGSTIYIGAVTYEHEPESWQVNTTKTWNNTMLPELNNAADFYIVHNYFTPYNENSNTATITSSAITETAKVIDFVKQTLQSNGVAIKPVVMTEWNMWARDSKQQVSNVSGLFAVLVVGESIRKEYGLAARWDLLNSWENGNDHGLFSDGNEPGVPKWTPRPSFFYMYYFDKMLGDRLIQATSDNTDVKVFGSTFSSGQAAATLVNTGATAKTVEVKVKNIAVGDRFYWYSLEGSNDNGEFSRKVSVNGQGTASVAGGPASYASIKPRSALVANGIKVTVPARGMVTLVVDGK
jgi:hypothetical protein